MSHVLSVVRLLLRPTLMVAWLLLLPALCACSALSHGSPEASPQPVTAAKCAIQCLSAAAANLALGFITLEPSYLPRNFSLYTRYLRNEAKVPIPPMPPGEQQASAKAQNVVLQYRFKASLNISSLNVLEESVPDEGSGQTQAAKIRLTSPDCGEVISSHSQTIYYAHGLATVSSNGDGSYEFCRGDDRDIHYAALISGKVLVQIIGFAESGITRDDVIKIATSLHPVH